jgi:hypothetical protein
MNTRAKGSRTGKSLVSAAWAGAFAAYVLEKSSKYIEYSCGFSPGALAIALRRRTGIRSTSPFATPTCCARTLPRVRLTRSRSLWTLASALIVAVLVPKCPLCLTAYLAMIAAAFSTLVAGR